MSSFSDISISYADNFEALEVARKTFDRECADFLGIVTSRVLERLSTRRLPQPTVLGADEVEQRYRHLQLKGRYGKECGKEFNGIGLCFSAGLCGKGGNLAFHAYAYFLLTSSRRFKSMHIDRTKEPVALTEDPWWDDSEYPRVIFRFAVVPVRDLRPDADPMVRLHDQLCEGFLWADQAMAAEWKRVGAGA